MQQWMPWAVILSVAALLWVGDVAVNLVDAGYVYERPMPMIADQGG